MIKRVHLKRFLTMAITSAVLTGMATGCNQKEAVSDVSSSSPETTVSQSSTGTASETDLNTTVSKTAADKTTKAPAVSTTKSSKTGSTTTTKAAPRPSDKKTSKQVYFGFYGVAPDPVELDTAAVTYSETDYVNVLLIGSGADEVDYALKLAKKNRSKIWVNIHGALFTSPSVLSSLWKERFDAVDAAARNSGAYDCLLGYYLDEPLLCGISHADLLAVTKYNKEQFGKRFFVCFAVSGVAPEVWNSPDASPAITKETGKYLTDIAFDMYWDFKQHKATYDKVIAGMKTRIGRDDVKVWYVPCVMNPSGSFTEQKAIEHLQGMYDYLKKEKNPGGLLCYTLRTSNGDGLGNIGLDEMKTNPWNNLRKECMKIGREICSGKLDK